MDNAPAKGAGAIGAMLLVLAAWQLLTGGKWVVWLILGFLLGGFGWFKARKSPGDDA